MTVLFHSTRGQASVADIRQVALAGLAPDGGLYLPQQWPQFSAADIAAMRGLPYAEVAFRVLRPFMQSAIPARDLRAIIDASYAVFDHPSVAPVVTLGERLHLLELFHGPTLAFKDFALQFLGHVFDYFLGGGAPRMTVIGATSGDTGSAAIAALANRKNIDVFILYPQRGPSDIQRKQMTCVEAPNIHALAIDGTFDDCQHIVKSLFGDATLRDRHNFSTVNSINMLRILAQIVYYFAASTQIEGTPSFVVPTGNFGDVFAGYAAMRCGLPIHKLVVATNSNDILPRFFATGHMSPQPVRQTLSPSMDIQISSNFERLLFDICGREAGRLRDYMNDLKKNAAFSVSPEQLNKLSPFLAASVNDADTILTIADIYRAYGYVLDPHSAVGVAAARKLMKDLPEPVICVATAHAAKFPQTVARATGLTPDLPGKIAALIKTPERTILLPADVNQVAAYIQSKTT